MNTLDDRLNQINRNSGSAIKDHELVNTFRGFNMDGGAAAIPMNKENRGFTFFTRPRLNLSDETLYLDRPLKTLLNDDPNSMARAVRCILDHTLHDRGITSTVVDPLTPFIPLFSNNLVSLTGWRDYITQTSSTAPGIFRETIEYVDDTPHDFESYDLAVSFRQISGDPISFALYIWTRWMKLAKIGTVSPYPEDAVLNEICYNTRIWRIMTDLSRRKITRIACCGYAFPTAVPMGNIFNINNDGPESPFSAITDQISTQFRCGGTIYYDYLLVYLFNWLVEKWHPLLRDEARQTSMTKIPPHLIRFFRHSAYPHITVETLELDWYLETEYYNAAVQYALAGNYKTSTTADISTGVNEALSKYSSLKEQ